MSASIHIPFYDHGAEYRLIRHDIDHAIERVLLSGEYEQGDEVASFEKEFSAYLGLPCAVTTGSCHGAMYRGMLALGIGSGDEVITPSNTDIACTVAIRRTGAAFVFAEIDERTHNLDPVDLIDRITPRTRAILAVHMYGHPADMAAIQQIANEHDLLIIEDAAIAVGATYQGKRVGGFGDIGCFSHAPSKILGNCGDGGTLVMHDEAMADRIRHQFIYWQMRATRGEASGVKMRRGFEIIEEGMHGRMVEISAAILRVKLQHLDQWVAARQHLADTYREHMSGLDLILPEEVGAITHAYRNFVVRVQEREDVRRRLAELGVETNMHYTPPLHLQPVYASLGYRRGDFPVTERVSEELFTLPIYPHLSETQVAWVCEAMAQALA
jgi:dTDP-4-amino-4,6-dideoxygalactose transaminase